MRFKIEDEELEDALRLVSRPILILVLKANEDPSSNIPSTEHLNADPRLTQPVAITALPCLTSLLTDKGDPRFKS